MTFAFKRVKEEVQWNRHKKSVGCKKQKFRYFKNGVEFFKRTNNLFSSFIIKNQIQHSTEFVEHIEDFILNIESY